MSLQLPTKSTPFHWQVDQFTVERNYRALFSPLSLSLKNGESLYIEGANGVGKSTSLRVFAGVSQRFKGSMLLNDLPRSEWSYLYGRAILYLGHHLSLKSDLSGLENLQLLLNLKGKTVSEREILTLFEMLQIPRQPRPLRYLSAGQKRRVFLARLWLEEAPIWILDEPFTSLDTASIELIEEKLKEHRHEGGALIFTSHQKPSPSVYSSHIILERGND